MTNQPTNQETKMLTSTELYNPELRREARRAEARKRVAERGPVLRQDAADLPVFDDLDRKLGCAASRWDNGKTTDRRADAKRADLLSAQYARYGRSRG